MKNAPIKITRDLSPPKEMGTHFRLLCLTGKNKGVSYYLKSKRVIAGRGETANIRLLDAKSSREHVELTYVKDGYVLTDLGSQNGVIVNDLKVVQHQLEDGDKIIIGQTVFKYSCIKVTDSLALVEEEESSFETDLFSDESNLKDIKVTTDKDKRKKIIIAVVALLLIFVFMGDDNSNSDKKGENVKNANDIEVNDKVTGELKNKAVVEEKDVKEKIDGIVHRGRREFRERNFFRAIDEYNRALILTPTSGYIKYLIDRTRQRLDEEIEQSFFKSSQCIEARRYGCAKVSLCSIVRYLQEYKDDQRYKDAKKQIEIVEDKMGIEKGEIKCF